MEHIRQFDWCYSQPDINFLRENDFEHSVTEKILRNKFRDPLISSDSDDEKPSIDWEKIFTEKQNGKKKLRLYVPGLRSVPQYPKVSALTYQQQYQCMKVVCYENPHILQKEFIPRPTKGDYKVFEELKETYEKEQKEFKEWAKMLWTTNHCTRALRPKPPVETTYEALFKLRANEFESYPKNYNMAAQIPLDSVKSSELTHMKDLITINVKDLPLIKCESFTKFTTIMKHCATPEPCNKHRCRFILPTEEAVTELPLSEVQRELAQYAADNNAQVITSEKAMRCLVELDQAWQLPVAVCEVYGTDGEPCKVVVLGSDFANSRESVLVRTYRAFRHLLEYALVPSSEKSKLLRRNEEKSENTSKSKTAINDTDSSDDEDGLLRIDEDQMQMDISDYEDLTKDEKDGKHKQPSRQSKQMQNEVPPTKNNHDEFYKCTCQDTPFERPPPRSYRKWQFRDKETGDTCDVIVHTSHRVRDESGEVYLEPIPEYQLDVGASEPTPDHIRSLMLALRLRNSPSLLSVRVDNATGEIVTMESQRGDKLTKTHEALLPATPARAHSAYAQLRLLRPGRYVLVHEVAHGANVMLYVATAHGTELTLSLRCDQAEADDARDLRAAPSIATALLPTHKFRRLLPCAFSPHENQVKAPRQPPRQKTPPQALKWPKRRRNRSRK